MSVIQLALSTLLALALAPDTSADCGETVCTYSSSDSDGVWSEDETLSRKARQKQAKNNKKRRDVAFNVEVVGGRGSVFVDGRYLATSGPHAALEIKPGKHEVEVRDGEEQIVVGVIKIPRSAESFALVVHVDR